MNNSYHIKSSRHFIRAIIRPFFKFLFNLISRIRINGKGNIPTDGAYIIAFNHVSLYDPPFILAFWPAAPEVGGASDLLDKPGISILVSLYGTIPIRRGEYDRQSINSLLNALEAGLPLLVAPEGTRSHSPGMERAQPGIAFLADRAGVPVLPVGVVGSTEDFLSKAIRFKRPVIEMFIGDSFVLPPLEGKGTDRQTARQKNADLVMQKIADLLPREYQGVYQD